MYILSLYIHFTIRYTLNLRSSLCLEMMLSIGDGPNGVWGRGKLPPVCKCEIADADAAAISIDILFVP